jgi:short chain dehydrogenase
MGRLDGKTALVAGASGGIGGAGATMLAREGAAVVCGDVDGAAAEARAAAIRAVGGKAVATTLDVADPVSIDAAVRRTATEFGGADILLDSAGISTTASVLELTRAAWDRVPARPSRRAPDGGPGTRRQHRERDVAASRGRRPPEDRVFRLEGRRALAHDWHGARPRAVRDPGQCRRSRPHHSDANWR